MKATESSLPTPSRNSGRSPLLLAILCFILGAALAGFWFHRTVPVREDGKPAFQLSDATKKLLAGLAAPATIHFYSLLPADSADATASAQLAAARADYASARRAQASFSMRMAFFCLRP